MSRRFYKQCLLWLLPLLVAQSLVPVGFMVGAGQQGLTLNFCPVQSARVVEVLGIAVADHSLHANHVGHHANAAGATDSPDESRSASCPYALTRTAIAHTPILVVAALSLIQVDVIGRAERLQILQAGPFAPNRIRGPPQHLA